MAVETRSRTRQGTKTVFVNRFCDGIIGPSTEMLGPVRDGGHIVANTAPGCWGPMITPCDQGRPRGDAPGRGRGRGGGRRGRDPHPRHLGDVPGHGVGQRPHDRGPLQRRPVLRQGVRVVRPGGRGDGRRGHRPRQRALRELRRAGRAVRVHERLHDRVRRRVAGRRDGREGPGRGDRRRRRHERRAPRELDPEPDPALRPARPRRRRDAAAAVHGPARDDARGRPARLAQRRRLRGVPARRAALARRRVRNSSSPAPTGTWTSTPRGPARW